MIEGLFILFQDVGQLAPTKARALVNRCKNNIIGLEDKFPNWKIVTIPVRPPQETEFTALKLTKKGVIVFYIDVGTLSPVAAEALISRIKDDNSCLDKLGEQVAKIYISTRCEESTVEYLDLEEKDVESET